MKSSKKYESIQRIIGEIDEEIGKMMRVCFFFFKQKTAYEIGTGDWSSDVCSSDLTFCRAREENVANMVIKETKAIR